MIKINKLKGYEDVLEGYFLQDDGRVYSKYKKGYLTERDNGKGYKGYRLKIKGKRRWVVAYTHRVIALAFSPNPKHKSQVNHIDENKSNNSINNLEWATALENVRHGTGVERGRVARGNEIYVYDYALTFIGKYKTISDAAREVLGYRDTSVKNKRCNDYYFLTERIEDIDLKELNKFNSKTLVLENLDTQIKKIYPNNKSLQKVFPTSNISNAINKKYTLIKNGHRYKVYPIDFTTLKDSPNLYEKQV